MVESIDDKMMERWKQFSSDVETLLESNSHALGNANPPDKSGVYILYDEHMAISYVGIATDLHDRLLNKHVSGDESHAIQRAYKRRFPDRIERRNFIKENVRAKWHQMSDPARLGDIERLLIWLLQPALNRR